MSKSSNTAAEACPQAANAKPAAAIETPVIFTLHAVCDTWLKKSTDPAIELPEDQKVLVEAGKRLPVVATSEIPRNSHELVELGASAGQWHVYMPHFRRLQGAVSPAPAGTGGRLVNILFPDEPSIPEPDALSMILPENRQPGVIDWSNFGSSITPNLTVGEVLQFDHRRRPSAQSAAVPRILETAREFQVVRMAWGRPLGVTSFYRPEPINREVGGVRNSFHVSGLAVDLYPIGLPLQALYDFLIGRWTGGFGDGRNRGFIHLDRRGGGRFVPSGGVRPAAVWPY